MSSSRKLSFLHRYKAEQRSLNFKVTLRGPVHTYQDIFIKKAGFFPSVLEKNTCPHVAFSNHFRPSTRKR